VSLVWGYVNCAFYIIPAAVYRSSTYLDQIDTYFLEKKVFVDISRMVYSPWGWAGVHETNSGPMSVQIGTIQLLALLIWAGGFILRRKTNPKNVRETNYFGALVIAAIIMMLPISLSIWQLFKPLMSLQFPWRLLFVVNLGTAVLVAEAVQRWTLKPNRGYLNLFLIIMLVGLNRPYWHVGRYYIYEDPTRWAVAYPGTLTLLLEETPKWHVPANEFQYSNSYGHYEIIEGEAQVSPLIWKTNYHKFEINNNEEIIFADKTNYWPGWQAYLDGKKVPLMSQWNIRSKGMLAFTVPAGRHVAESRLTEPPLNKMADAISLVSLFSGLWVVVRSKYAKVHSS
jgi:hypothetical protein